MSARTLRYQDLAADYGTYFEHEHPAGGDAITRHAIQLPRADDLVAALRRAGATAQIEYYGEDGKASYLVHVRLDWRSFGPGDVL